VEDLNKFAVFTIAQTVTLAIALWLEFGESLSQAVSVAFAISAFSSFVAPSVMPRHSVLHQN
jgi:hypothetical protein